MYILKHVAVYYKIWYIAVLIFFYDKGIGEFKITFLGINHTRVKATLENFISLLATDNIDRFPFLVSKSCKAP